MLPTGNCSILHERGHILFIKTYDHHDKIYGAQRKIWNLLTSPRGYSNPDSPGSFTVICIWGLGEAERRWIIFDHEGEHDLVRAPLPLLRQAIFEWYKTAKSR